MKRRPGLHKQALVCIVLLWFIISSSDCSHKSDSGNGTGGGPNPPPVTGPTVTTWLTKNDQSVLLQKQPSQTFGTITNSDPYVDVDTTQVMQTVDGFGYTLTGGSAFVINKMGATEKSNLLTEL